MNETTVTIDDVDTRVLLDIGSVVSLVSEVLKKTQLPDSNIKPIYDILKVKWADSEDLPYLGCIIAELRFTNGFPQRTWYQHSSCTSG